MLKGKMKPLCYVASHKMIASSHVVGAPRNSWCRRRLLLICTSRKETAVAIYGGGRKGVLKHLVMEIPHDTTPAFRIPRAVHSIP